MKHLSSVFAIDLVGYAIMSNHYHVLLRLAGDRAAYWSDAEVIERWGKIFRLPDEEERASRVTEWRKRLCSLSWYMRCINEPLARLANREDDCVGRFWQGRFDTQAILDDPSLLKCLTYVDLNPIRAGAASTLEQSANTSIKARLDGNDQHLVPFIDDPPAERRPLPLRRNDYFNLVDWSGRCLRRGKRGHISEDVPSIIDNVPDKGDRWISEMRHYSRWYFRALGSLDALERYRKHLGVCWLKGASRARTAVSIAATN